MAERYLDDADWRILRELQRDARLSNVDLADKVNLSPSPCLRRVRRLEQEGIIEHYRAELNRTAIGLGLTVFIDIRVGRHSQDNANALSEALADIPEVVSCYMVSGDADFLAEVAVPDLPAYERLLSEKLLVLPMIEGLKSNFALRSIKTHGDLNLPDM